MLHYKHTSPLMRVIGIADDLTFKLTIMGPLQIITPFFLELKQVERHP